MSGNRIKTDGKRRQLKNDFIKKPHTMDVGILSDEKRAKEQQKKRAHIQQTHT